MKNDHFIPHKDISLPPLLAIDIQMDFISIVPISKKTCFGYFNNRDLDNLDPVIDFIEELRNDPDFITDAEPLDYDWLSHSKFCLFFFTDTFVSISGIGKALRYGCVPVVITDRAIVNLPFVDVLKWTEIAVFVDIKAGLKNLKDVLGSRCAEDKYEKMREFGMEASTHFAWNFFTPHPSDAFYTVLYQLWLRRHTIRYTSREMI
ncbi:Exostosin-like [Thalictrum thalictroides]|uniref:Exostosin-like n=1 Tax=Thalictrum thalictroides TaxID=46969 RepID=A0A7J6WES1_THATH|nr:Exostosin-like [Thalictrum thalictroides]